jgi:ppGpp synthetase/RelA/SpoT-type nucleotidyltranferase
MNYDEYRTQWISLYEEFAQTVRFIVEQALRANDAVPKPQSLQHRAKSLTSIRDRLEEEGKLDTQSLETERRDLAGVRLIFYTETDAQRFIQSQIISENFEIEPDGVKIHHPTEENDNAHYRGTHFTVRLGAKRTQLPEYARFAGRRCEIQIQTILNHAWSETSHNLYKEERRKTGFGTRARERLKDRFDRVMKKHLEPAGRELQRIQAESERILQGKALVDADILKQLAAARDNNERYQILTGLRDNVIWNLDDVPGEYEKMRQPLLDAANAARQTPTQPLKIADLEYNGYAADDVVKVIIEIFNQLRYQDPKGTLIALAELYKGAGE